MKIDEIKVGEHYYSWGRATNGGFRLLDLHIKFKYKWTCGGFMYEVAELGNRELGDWSGYPDNLYKTIDDALNNLQKKVQELVDSRKPKKDKAEIVKCSSPYICCDTCLRLVSNHEYGDWCESHQVAIDKPKESICKGAAEYKCFDVRINQLVREATNTTEDKKNACTEIH